MLVVTPLGLYSAYHGAKDGKKSAPFTPNMMSTILKASALGAGVYGLYTGANIYHFLKDFLPSKKGRLIAAGLGGTAIFIKEFPILLGAGAVSYSLGYGLGKLFSRGKKDARK
jgi:hypothetical protein